MKHAFHADSKSESWVECNGRVGQEMFNRNSQSSIMLMPDILSKLPVMLYAGDQDFICNYMGIESMIQAMEWNGGKGLGVSLQSFHEEKALTCAKTVETKSWTVDNIPAGTWVESRNLTYVKVCLLRSSLYLRTDLLQIFNSSHMVPYDVPVVAHDMMLRFMGVNFSAIADGSARIPSKVGDEEKPIATVIDSQKDSNAAGPPGKSPEQDKAMWEGLYMFWNSFSQSNVISAYYNAGSAALVLLLIALAVGLFLFCRRKRRISKVAFRRKVAEESIPLNMSIGDDMNGHFDGQNGKGKEREVAIFDVGDDEDMDYHDEDKRTS